MRFGSEISSGQIRPHTVVVGSGLCMLQRSIIAIIDFSVYVNLIADEGTLDFLNLVRHTVRNDQYFALCEMAGLAASIALPRISLGATVLASTSVPPVT